MPRCAAGVILVVRPGNGESAGRRINGEGWEAADAELLEAQARAALGHIQRIASDVVVHPPEFDISERLSSVDRAREHDLILRYIAGLIAFVSDVDGPVWRDRRRGALVEWMRVVAYRDRAGPGDAIVVRNDHHDFRRDVAGTVRALVEQGPRDVHIAAGPGRDPFLIVEKVVGGFVVDHHRSAPGGATVAGGSHRDAARGAVREAAVVNERGIVECAIR